jgi:tRNA A37 threonylcarbamoyladenosine biosynthesis protein TsaE
VVAVGHAAGGYALTLLLTAGLAAASMDVFGWRAALRPRAGCPRSLSGWPGGNSMSITFLEDIPAETPEFGFDLVARSLAPLLLRQTQGALVLGIHGPWGSGKTTLMQAIRRELEARGGEPRPVFVEFNAWKFSEREALWRALILHLLAELRRVVGEQGEQQLDELEQSMYQAFVVQEKGPWVVNWRSVITEVISIALSVVRLGFVAPAIPWVGRLFGSGRKGEAVVDDQRIEQLGAILERTTVRRQVNQVQSIEQFLERFQQITKKLRGDGGRIYVLVDDLDRCLPDAALDIFESIKLFLDSPECVFLVALDRDVIRKGLSLRYGSGTPGNKALLIDPDEYIEKTISISYDLPRLSDNDARDIINGFGLPIDLSEAHRQLLIAGLGVNPRRIKRFMNTLALQLDLAALAADQGRPVPPCLLRDGDRTSLDCYLKLLLISYRFSGLFALAFDDDQVLARLQEAANAAEQERQQRIESLASESPIIAALTGDEEFWRLMRSGPRFRKGDPIVSELLRWFRR